MIQRFIPVLAIISLLISPLMALPPNAWSAGASVVFGPSSVSMSPGSQASVTVLITSDQPVNSADITVTFPAALMSVVKVDTSSTDFPSMFMGPPSYDNAGGTIHFLQSKIGGTTSGALGTIVFQAKAVGTGALGVKAGANIVAADGHGTNVYSGASGGAVQVNTAATPPPAPAATPTPQGSFKPSSTKAPAISSSTHPDQEKWYAGRDVDISWTGGGDGYNVAFDQSPTTQLGEKVSTTETKAHTTLAENGAWFAHVRASGGNGWSATSHFRLQSDSMVPVGFTPVVTPNGKVDVLPKITFETSDATSGIDHYEIKLGDGQWLRATSPYQVPKINSGNYPVSVKAFDRAGNTTIGDTEFTLVGPDAPVITSPTNKKLFMLGETVNVKGTAQPGVSVDIFLNDKKMESVLADQDGFFSASQSFLLFAGAYKLVAQAISPSGLSSQPSIAINLTIDAKAIKIFGAVWPGWLVLVLAVMVFGTLLMLTAVAVYRIWQLGKVWLRRVGWMKKTMTEELQDLEHVVDTAVDTVLAGNTIQAQQLKDEIGKAVQGTEDKLAEVEATMLEPEPWAPFIPILHGSARFKLAPAQDNAVLESGQPNSSETKAEILPATEKEMQKNVAEVKQPPKGTIPNDAKVAYGTTGELPSRESQGASAPVAQKIADSAQKVEESQKSVVVDAAAPVSAKTAASPLPATPPEPVAATSVNVDQTQPTPVVENKVADKPSEEPKIEIDLLAPKIEQK